MTFFFFSPCLYFLSVTFHIFFSCNQASEPFFPPFLASRLTPPDGFSSSRLFPGCGAAEEVLGTPRMGSKVGTPWDPSSGGGGCRVWRQSPIQWYGQFEPLPLSRSGGTQKFLCRCPLGTACLVERGPRCCRPPRSGLRDDRCCCLPKSSASAAPGASLLRLRLSA